MLRKCSLNKWKEGNGNSNLSLETRNIRFESPGVYFKNSKSHSKKFETDTNLL